MDNNDERIAQSSRTNMPNRRNDRLLHLMSIVPTGAQSES